MEEQIRSVIDLVNQMAQEIEQAYRQAIPPYTAVEAADEYDAATDIVFRTQLNSVNLP